ncbi:MAG: DUF3801 domain-containing protein [Flavonifractor plautii]
MVRMLLSGTEVVIRLSGSALKNLLALTLALARNHKKLSGKVNLGKMLRETRDLRQFSMTPEQYKEFQHRARKQKLLFATVRDRDGWGKLIDVILPVTELDRAQPDLPAYAVPGTGPAAGSTHPREGADEGAYQPRKGPAGAPEAPQDPHGTGRTRQTPTQGRQSGPDGPTSRQIRQKRVSGRDAARAIQEPAPLPPKAKEL